MKKISYKLTSLLLMLSLLFSASSCREDLKNLDPKPVHDNMGLNYHSVYDNVRESWAIGASYALTRMVYPNHKGRQSNANLPAYTNVVLDMLDTPSDDGLNEGFTSALELVEGYTIKQIQDALLDQRTWNEWRDNIKNKYENATKNEVDRLFAAWNI